MKGLIVGAVFLLILTGHLFYSTPRNYVTTTDNGKWAAYTFDKPAESLLNRYIAAGEYWLGLSYALAGSFAAFTLALAISRKQSIADSSGGIAFSGILWGSVCFITGCCGSPMLPIYLGLLGPKFIGVTKPLTFGLTLVSIAVGAWLMVKRQADEGVNLVQIQRKTPTDK